MVTFENDKKYLIQFTISNKWPNIRFESEWKKYYSDSTIAYLPVSVLLRNGSGMEFIVYVPIRHRYSLEWLLCWRDVVDSVAVEIFNGYELFTFMFSNILYNVPRRMLC